MPKVPYCQAVAQGVIWPERRIIRGTNVPAVHARGHSSCGLGAAEAGDMSSESLA